jgi:hypothetical protein
MTPEFGHQQIPEFHRSSIPEFRRFATSGLRRFEIPEFRRFVTSELHRFKIPEFHRFATSGLRRFKIPDLHRLATFLKTHFMIFVKLDVSRVTGFSSIPQQFLPPYNALQRLYSEKFARRLRRIHHQKSKPRPKL